DPENYFDVTKKIAVDAVRPFVLGENHQLGVNTPHIVFNFLDFLLWKQLREMNREVHFEFEFRNSVEHWYPQNPTEAQDGCPPWNSVDGHGSVDRFGNLALLPTNINSRFSNQSPVGKKGYESVIAKGSLKLRKMAEKTVSSEQWRTQNCEEHESEMLAILRDSLCIC
ncbi:MAG: HNH endonuclease, partial [Lentisphaeria bacterium]|nr:HNH endonuclease [Lentisphaeria bacterium]